MYTIYWLLDIINSLHHILVFTDRVVSRSWFRCHVYNCVPILRLLNPLVVLYKGDNMNYNPVVNIKPYCNTHTQTHTHTHIQMCVCIYIYIIYIQWYLFIRTPFDSNNSQSEHIWRTNFDLQCERGLSIQTQKHVAADATFPPVCRSRLHFSAVNTSLYCDSGTAFKSLWPVVALITPAPKSGHFLPTTAVNVAFYSGHMKRRAKNQCIYE